MSSSVTFARIFKKASVTYYYSSIFFPRTVRNDVFALYAFVRTADDFVDQIPQDKKGFERFYKETLRCLDSHGRSKNTIIESFLELARRKKFRRAWIVAFLNAMRADLTKTTYKSYTELEQYMYGSAEVIGLMMARIMDLPPESYKYARAQGRAMQLINFIRDVEEDRLLGRAYLAYSTPAKELSRYIKIQEVAQQGYRFIPKRYLLPVKTAADMYGWTASQIRKDPSVIYRRKVKPKPFRVLAQLVYNALTV